jgi:hypothetical protein
MLRQIQAGSPRRALRNARSRADRAEADRLFTGAAADREMYMLPAVGPQWRECQIVPQ